MKKNKPRRSMPAAQHRAVKKYTSEARETLRKPSKERSADRLEDKFPVAIPTVLRRVIEIVPSVAVDELPEELQDAVSRVTKNQHNANRTPAVQLFNRKDGIHASKNSTMSYIDLYTKVNGAVDELDQSILEARLSRFTIFGVNKRQKGTRYVSAILDDESRMALQFQSNIIRRSAGLEPASYILPFHLSVYSTLDQQEAEAVLESCRNTAAQFCIALSGPQIKTVVQRDGPANLR